MKKENYSFPVENELSKIRKKINNPAYLYKNKILPDNASAEEKPCARNPKDRIRLSSEFLSESSSSTIEMSGTLDIQLVSPLVGLYSGKKPYSAERKSQLTLPLIVRT